MEITINDTTEVFTMYGDGENYLLNKLRYWNNFESATPLTITITKPLDPAALNVNTSDVADIKDLFGRV